MYKLETAPLTLSGIFQSGWKLYKSCFFYVIIWTAILSLIHVTPYYFGFVGFYHQEIAGKLQLSWSALIFFFVLLIVEAFAVAIIFYNMYLSGKEQKVSQKQAFQNALHTFVNMYIGLVAYYFIANIGLYVYIIPGLFFGVLFVMAIPAIVIEKQTVYAAFENSVRLVWGHWWQTFFALAVPYFLLYLLRNFGKFTPWEGEWVLLIDAAVLALLMPYYYAVLLVQYNNIKIIKSLPEPISHRSHH